MPTKPPPSFENPPDMAPRGSTMPKPLSQIQAVAAAGPEVLAESVLTCKGQVTIPQAIRNMFQLDAGDSLVWRLEKDGRLLVEPKRTLTLADIRAAIAAAGAPTPARAFSKEEMDDAIAKALEEKLGRH